MRSCGCLMMIIGVGLFLVAFFGSIAAPATAQVGDISLSSALCFGGGPTALLLLFFGDRMQKGATAARKHNEILEAQRQQADAMQQLAQMTTAQARMQAAAMHGQIYGAPPALQQPDYRPMFDTAREHIKANRYTEARAILQAINNEQARDWLTKLDTLESRQ